MHTPNWLQRLLEGDDDLTGDDPPDLDGPPATPDDPRWDDGQREVIHAPVDERLLVQAGPGAGKTDVACARVARFVDDGIPGDRILLVSFTNAAVEEMRDRIRNLGAADAHQLASVHVRTIDSLAAVLRFNYREEEVDFSGYDENLEDFLDLLRNPTTFLTDYLDSFRHVIVDEAQDVTGLRRRVLEELFDHLPDRCGITVFGDSCQSIYGWTRDAPSRGKDGDDRTLLDYLAEDHGSGFRPVPLGGQYRTTDEELKTLKADLRDLIQERGQHPEDRYQFVRERLADYGSDEKVRWKEIPELLRGRDRTMVLFRTTAALAMASSYLNGEGIDHRIRYSGMPRLVAPWVGHIFSDFFQPDMAEGVFYERWEETPSHLRRRHEPDEAWRILRTLAGERGTIKPSLLRYRLAGRRPPESLLGKELGTSGPLLSTIHAAKGREAPEVVLLLTAGRDEEDTEDIGEEARVLYVGATRPREVLDVLDRPDPRFMSLDSGRVCRYARRNDWLQMFLGLDHDVDAVFSVDRRLEHLDTDAQQTQKAIASVDRLPHEVRAEREQLGEKDWRYLIRDGERILGSISSRADSEIWDAGRRFLKGKKRPAPTINHLWLHEPSTRVLAEDDARLDRVAEPYGRTGFWLGPVIEGFPSFPYFGSST